MQIDSGVFFSLRKFYPKYFNWLSKLGLGLSRCLICSETESKALRLISCPECPFSYCPECWQDTEVKFTVILQKESASSLHNFLWGKKKTRKAKNHHFFLTSLFLIIYFFILLFSQNQNFWHAVWQHLQEKYTNFFFFLWWCE